MAPLTSRTASSVRSPVPSSLRCSSALPRRTSSTSSSSLVRLPRSRLSLPSSSPSPTTSPSRPTLVATPTTAPSTSSSPLSSTSATASTRSAATPLTSACALELVVVLDAPRPLPLLSLWVLPSLLPALSTRSPSSPAPATMSASSSAWPPTLTSAWLPLLTCSRRASSSRSSRREPCSRPGLTSSTSSSASTTPSSPCLPQSSSVLRSASSSALLLMSGLRPPTSTSTASTTRRRSPVPSVTPSSRCLSASAGTLVLPLAGPTPVRLDASWTTRSGVALPLEPSTTSSRAPTLTRPSLVSTRTSCRSTCRSFAVPATSAVSMSSATTRVSALRSRMLSSSTSPPTPSKRVISV
mmetsp:Transcript_2482/g.5689  ORF Transcript_2482/g.5689 Transcript_2482/m.5689 type:complete len:354 (+) Transcript_2482:3705-4766(+)